MKSYQEQFEENYLFYNKKEREKSHTLKHSKMFLTLSEMGVDKYYRVANKEFFTDVAFSEKNQTWYAFSVERNKIYEFCVGLRITKDDFAYMPSTEEEVIDILINHCLKRYKDHVESFTYEIVEKLYDRGGGTLLYKNKYLALSLTFKKDINYTYAGETEIKYIVLDNKFGKGEWEAKTIDDCRIMAVQCAFNFEKTYEQHFL